MTRANDIRRNFRETIARSDATLIVPGVHDPVSAMLAAREGFPAVYAGSYSFSATLLGQPDTGLVTMTEAAAATRAIANAVDIPVLTDAENGWTHAANIWRAVHLFEESGAAGFHIEDHQFGKHTSAKPQLATIAEMVGKIRAACDARSDPNFLIIARTDVPWASGDMAETVARLNAFTDAGADIVMPAGISPDKLKTIRSQIKGRVLVTDKPGFTAADEQAAGADIVIYYGFTLLAAYGAVRDGLRNFRQARDADAVPNTRQNAQEFERFLDYSGYVARAAKYQAD